jgi:hypothetical protein
LHAQRLGGGGKLLGNVVSDSPVLRNMGCQQQEQQQQRQKPGALRYFTIKK